MSSELSGAVKIRLEVEVPQGKVQPVIVPEQPRVFDVLPRITEPPTVETGQPPPVVHARCDSSGNCVICTRGTDAAPNRPVFAKVYLSTQAPSILAGPDDGIAWHYANGSARWGGLTPSDPAFEVPVPQPAPDTLYTLVVWSDASSGFLSARRDFKILKSSFTECQGSGSGSGFGPVTSLVPGVSIPTTLYAHVSNAGPASRAYGLAYDPNTMAWSSDSVCGPRGFRLLCRSGKWQLDVKGPKTYHPFVAECGPSPPFQIEFRDVDLSAPGCAEAVKARVEILVSG